jgi:hypothetical protein
VPTPPDLSPSHEASLIYTLAFVVVYSVAILWSIQRARRGDALALWCILAGTVMVLIEPLLDFLSVFTYSADNVAIIFWAFDVPIPLLAVLGYGFYFGAEAYLGCSIVARGAGARDLWKLYAFAWVMDVLLEGIAIASDLFGYYGPHAFDIWGQPLWFPFINAAFPIVCGVVLYGLRNVLRGARVALVVPVSAFLYAAVYVGAGWPAFVSMHADVGGWVRWLAGGATIALALGTTWAGIRLMEWLRTVQTPAAPEALAGSYLLPARGDKLAPTVSRRV